LKTSLDKDIYFKNLSRAVGPHFTSWVDKGTGTGSVRNATSTLHDVRSAFGTYPLGEVHRKIQLCKAYKSTTVSLFVRL